MGPIGNLPNGLLSLLDLKTMGNYPRHVADVIAPIIDVMPFLTRGVTQQRHELALDVVAGTTSAGGAYNWGETTAANELTLLSDWAVQVVAATAGSIVNPAVFGYITPQESATGGVILPGDHPFQQLDHTLVGTNFQAYSHVGHGVYIIPPGCQLNVWLADRATAAPATGVVRLHAIWREFKLRI